jgi:hypothetical protein
LLKLDRRAGLLIGLGLGAAIWLISPLITGRREPWDAEGAYYAGALLVAGSLGGVLAPRHWLSVVLGIFGGQIVVLLAGVVAEPANGGLWPLGVLFLGIYSVLALFGAVLGAGMRRFGATRTSSGRGDQA